MKDGILKMLPSGRWGVCSAGEEPIELTSGDCFWIEISGGGAMELTRMESARGAYYSIDGHQLRDGLRARYEGRGFRL